VSGNQITILGVDEAGYGPRLGPLVVGLSAFRVPADLVDLRAALPITTQVSGPLPVADSKEVYRAGEGLHLLEATVLAFRDAARDATVPDQLSGPRPPWSGSFPELPVAADAERAARSASALSTALEESGVEVLAVGTRTVEVREFNRGATERDENKATLLFDIAMELVAPFAESRGEVHVFVDRHGGRKFYAPLLADRFPQWFCWVVGESASCSRYRFDRPGGALRFSFEVGGDGLHLPIALASMAAKYVRELHMRAFNAWFSEGDPDLRPTAGYYGDASRWLAESETLRRRLSVDDADLIRVR
jgi:ribonuclease HII